MKTILTLLLALCLSIGYGQSKQPEPQLNLQGSKLINSKTAVWVGLGSLFIAGGLQNLHTMYVLQPELLHDKFGWKDPKDNQNVNLNNGGNSVFSFMKNTDHMLQAGTTFFACAGAASLTYNFAYGWQFKGDNTWKKIYHIVAPMVAGRLAMGLGGQVTNLWVKGQFDPL